MKPGIARKWVAALRSGKYEQARNALRNGDSFCCLGVLCNLHAQAHPEIAARQNSRDVYMGNDGTPPLAVLRWAGLRTPQGYFNGGSTLANRNDRGSSFETIADLIEKHAAEL